jgi:hypothetical protein
MTGRAIDPILNVDPMRENDKFRESVHSVPRNLFPCLDVFDHFQCLGFLADRIGRVASPAEFNVRNPSNAIFAGISMAKIALQLGDFLMVNMIVANRLINGFAS